MKCPKCNYISFDGADRCRNCGYDFALTPASTVGELPLRDAAGLVSPGADYPLVPSREPVEGPPDAAPKPAPGAERARRSGHGAVPAEPSADLPLFDQPMAGVDDTPLLRAPAEPRPPLAVRRSTATDTPRPRATPAAAGRGLRPSPSSSPTLGAGVEAGAELRDTVPAPAGSGSAARRLLAAAIDASILGAIDAAVLYFTLRLTGLDLARIGSLPIAPLLGFFAILNGGYLIGFTAASGQTIGKMIAAIRVVADVSTRVPLATAVVRTAAMLVTCGHPGPWLRAGPDRGRSAGASRPAVRHPGGRPVSRGADLSR